jgi:hypothetical protein
MINEMNKTDNVKECGCFQITISESERCFIYDKHIGIYQCGFYIINLNSNFILLCF